MPELAAHVPCAPQLLVSFCASSPGVAKAVCWGTAHGSHGSSASCPQAGSHDLLHFLWLAAAGRLRNMVVEVLRSGWTERLRAGPSLGTASTWHSPQP